MSINLEQEEIDGFLVSSEMKRLWALELEILEKVREVCDRNGIRFFADWGTLLGAVRHRGFIPWDDDLDLGMLAEDYGHFCEIAPSEFQEPYFFQSYRTEEGFTPWHIKIRRSDTTGATRWETLNAPTWNKGIFLDIFPLYPLTEDPERLARFRKVLAGKRRELSLVSRAKSGTLRGKYRLLAPLLKRRNYLQLEEAFTDLCRSGGLAPGETTGKVSATSFRSDKDSYIADKAWFDEIVELPFMDRTIPAPAMWNERLSALYGDYMTPVKDAAFHSDLIFDTEVSYRDNPAARAGRARAGR